nr:hypothetical protein [Lachnospiraceae bacterium]
MKVKMILEGKPFQTEFGIVGYSSVTLIQIDGRNILFDTGLKGCALHLKEALKKVNDRKKAIIIGGESVV